MVVISLSAFAWVQAATDNFERADGALGSQWAAHADLVILNGNLHNQSTAASWNFMGVYNGQSNPNEASIEWAGASDGCDTDGIGAGGIVFVDAFSSTANGYFMYYRGGGIKLFYVNGGALNGQVLNQSFSTSVTPSPGSVLKATFDVSTYTFKLYSNDQLMGTLQDAGQTNNLSTCYAGVMLYGNANNDVESFSAAYVPPTSDTTAPDAITGLTAGSPTSSSITLTWTSSGDDGSTGQAAAYDVRYSTSHITSDAAFNSATQASGEPNPKSAGQTETFTVTGLAASTTYYFNVKVRDEANNWSTLATEATATTSSGGGGETWSGFADSYEFDSAANWALSACHVVKNGELALDPACATAGWAYLAVCTKTGGANGAEMKFSATNSSLVNGAIPAGLAVMLDSPSPTANGYMIYKKASIYVYRIVAGVTGGSDKLVGTFTGTRPNPNPGESVKAEITDKGSGVKWIQFYVNGVADGSFFTINDPIALTSSYVGVVQWGSSGYSNHNNIDSYVRYYQGGGVPYRIAKEAGDGQVVPIMTTAPDSVKVLVTTEAGTPSKDVVVNFAVTQSRATLSVDAFPFEGKVWKEAESGTLTSPVVSHDTTSASNGKFVYAPIVSGNYGKGKVDIPIYLPEARSYAIWLRYLSPTGNSNSCSLRVDNGAPIYVNTSNLGIWDWFKAVASTNLGKGFHTITVQNREPGMQWDKILVIDKTISYTPSGTGGTGPAFPNVTNAQGIAATAVTLGNDSDTTVVVQASAYQTDGVTPLVDSPVSFTIDGTPGPANKIDKDPVTDNQRYTPGGQITLRARIFDQYFNRVPNVPVNWQITQGQGGSLSGSSSNTDANGEAPITFTAGSDTLYKIRATSSQLPGQEAIFTAKVGKKAKRMEYVSGNGQPPGVVGQLLGENLVVRIIAEDDSRYSGFPVTFEVKQGGGKINGQTITQIMTDTNGDAKAPWTLGSTPGTQKVQASAAVPTGSPIEFIATAQRGPATAIVKVSGDNPNPPCPIGLPLKNPFVVKVTDAYGNGIPSWTVRFSILQGTDAYIDTPGNQTKDVLTDTTGKAQVTLTMGSTSGEINMVSAEAVGLGVSPQVFQATATPGIASQILYFSGNHQDTVVTFPLAQPLVVKVTGPYGNAISGHNVKFSVKEGGGNFSGANDKTVPSGADGLASAVLTLGTQAGDSVHVVEVTAYRADIPSEPLQGSPIRFKATGNPMPPSKLVKYNPSDGQRKAAGATLDAIKARVTDIHGNPIAGRTVHFAVQGAGGSLQDPMSGDPVQAADVPTGTDGYASVIWTLPQQLGQWELIASGDNLQGQPLIDSPLHYTATSETGPAHTMTRISPDTLKGTVGKALTDNIKVKITDQFGNPKSGYPVTFTVVQPLGQGGGKVNNVPQATATTGLDGVAGVTWTLGTASGTENNIVNATAAVTVNQTLVFKASGLPDEAKTLVADPASNNQLGQVGTPLPKPIRARVIDQYSNGIPSHNVVFRVTQGNGKIEDFTDKTVPTGADGWAEVIWTLGPQPGSQNNWLEASARLNDANLAGSPATFKASATIGGPDSLKHVSGNLQSGRVGFFVTNDLKVRVIDHFGNPIAGHTVTFEVISRADAQGGSLDNDVDSVKTKVTDSNGMASVKFKCGNRVGININKINARAELNGQNLNGSPFTFLISATWSPAVAMEIVGGDKQKANVGKVLPLPLQVRAKDIYTNPVPDHPIRFRILNSEPGALGNGASVDTTVNTGTDGIARINWRLGKKTGTDNNIVESTSSSGTTALSGSPIRFTASADADITNKDRSDVNAFPVVLAADGQARSTIVVTLKDKFDNLVTNQAVFISASGSNNNIIQPSMPTDANGQATGFISSTKAEVKKVTARAVNHMIDLADTVQVQFTPLAASRIDYASIRNGNYQTRNVGTVLPESLKVVVLDANQNPIANHSVAFSVTQGGGELLDSQPVLTNANGIAWSRYRLGTKEGMNQVEARAVGSNGQPLVNSPVRFTETGVKNPAFACSLFAGDNQNADPGLKLPNPLVVKVVDNNGWPIWGEPVKFEVQFNNGAISGTNPVTTDMNGLAGMQVLAGTQHGLNVFTAALPNYPAIKAVTFNAQTIVGKATNIVYVSGADQHGIVNQTLYSALVVRTTDQYGNPASGVNVTFRVIEQAGVPGIGSFPGGVKVLNVTSDGNGLASTTYTLGKVAGKNMVQAASAGLQPERILFEVYGDADYAYSMEKYSGDKQKMQMGKELLKPICVMVKDQYGNPAKNGVVTFRVTQGGGSIVEPQPVLSNSNGIASSRWVLGPKPNVYNTAMAIASLPGGVFQPTFDATGEENNYPELTLPGAQKVNENDTVRFFVNATDGDGEPLYYSNDPTRWPEGATFDATGTREFVWTPRFDQGGRDYYAVFKVTDARGGQDEDSVKISVTNLNRAPQITSTTPNDDWFKKPWGETQEFCVEATDPDGDQLFYRWTIDNQEVPSYSASCYTLDTHSFRLAQHVPVRVEVYDIDGATDVHDWIIVTPVELKSLSSIVVPYEGVTVQWETASESGNVGFNILRSLTEAGEYKQINEKLIPRDANGKYKFNDKSIQAGRKYWYKLEDVSTSGIKTQHGPVLAEVAVPKEFDLFQNYPNPFNPTTTIRYQVPKAVKVKLEIFNIMGQSVRTLVDDNKEPGYHLVLWDGLTSAGSPASTGVYYYRISAGDFVMSKKMALLK